MQEIFNTILMNLEQVGIGALLFLVAYVSNILLGAWRNVNINGDNFNWSKIGQSALKFVVLGLGIGLLSITVSVLPVFVTYIGIEIAPETLASIDAIVIVGAFTTATLHYVVDCIDKLKEVLGINEAKG